MKDLLPKGARLVDGTARAAYYGGDYYEFAGKLKAADTASAEESGGTCVTFTIEGFQYYSEYPKIALYYDVSVRDDPVWTENPGLEHNAYRNTAFWGNGSASTDVAVNREVLDIEKDGEQLPQYGPDGMPLLDAEQNPIPSNNVRYSIVINAGAKDLAPDEGRSIPAAPA